MWQADWNSAKISSSRMSYLCLHYHFVFATKGRAPIIAPEWRAELHRYLAGTVQGLGGQCEIVNGTADHIHLLARPDIDQTIPDFMREIKRMSSKWVNSDVAKSRFAWQEGYAAFTVSASAVDSVRRYIENQEEHHRKRGFRVELMILLKRSGVKFDERYLD